MVQTTIKPTGKKTVEIKYVRMGEGYQYAVKLKGNVSFHSPDRAELEQFLRSRGFKPEIKQRAKKSGV